jgi:hypothetical protein
MRRLLRAQVQVGERIKHTPSSPSPPARSQSALVRRYVRQLAMRYATERAPRLALEVQP